MVAGSVSVYQAGVGQLGGVFPEAAQSKDRVAARRQAVEGERTLGCAKEPRLAGLVPQVS